MQSICGMDCCQECNRKSDCGGCQKTNGHPFGGKCIAAEAFQKGGVSEFENLKSALIDEFNSLGIKDLKVTDLNLLNGFYVNLEYKLKNLWRKNCKNQKQKLLLNLKNYFHLMCLMHRC